MVDLKNVKKPIGIITRGDIGRVYNVELTSSLDESKLSGVTNETEDSN